MTSTPADLLTRLLSRVPTVAAHLQARAAAETAEMADPGGYPGDGGVCAAAFAACPWWYRRAVSAYGAAYNAFVFTFTADGRAWVRECGGRWPTDAMGAPDEVAR